MAKKANASKVEKVGNKNTEKGQRCYGIHDLGARGRTNAIGTLVDKDLLTVSLFDQNVNTKVFNS